MPFWAAPKTSRITPEQALAGRDFPVAQPGNHAVLGRSMQPPWPDQHELLVVGMGCFWGAERLFWTLEGVHVTFVGYAGGYTPNPTYEEVCSGGTGHAEIVGIVYDPAVVTLDRLLAVFWENHDPTQGMRQGNDVGTQYRSVILASSADQLAGAQASLKTYQDGLSQAGFGVITTEIAPLESVYYAEDYHQQYLHHNPFGYCNHGFCQVPYSTKDTTDG